MKRKYSAQLIAVGFFCLSQASARGADDTIETLQDEVDSTIVYLRSTESDAALKGEVAALFERVRKSAATAPIVIDTACYRPGCVVTFSSRDAADLRRVSKAAKAALRKWNGVKLWAPIVDVPESRLVIALVGSWG